MTIKNLIYKYTTTPLVKVIISFIAWNAIGALSNMLNKLGEESLIDSKTIFLTSNTLSVIQWLGTLQVTTTTQDPRMKVHILEYIKFPTPKRHN